MVGDGGRERGILPESNPPAGRLRTKNLFSPSGVTFPNYRLKVLLQSSHKKDFCFLPFTPSPFHPSLCLLFIFYPCLSPPSDSVPSCLCPSLIISACIPVGPSHSLLLLLLLLFLLASSCVSPVQSAVDILSSTSHSGSRWECCDHVYCQSTAAASLQWDLCAVLPIFLTTFLLNSLD